MQKKIAPSAYLYSFGVALAYNAQPLCASVCTYVHVCVTLRMLSHPQFPWLAST